MSRSLTTPIRRPGLEMVNAVLRTFSVVRLQQRLLDLRFRSAGLERHLERIGPHRIAWWEGGTGPTLLLLHGFGGDATLTWSGQVAALARRHRLIVPDLLWFGESESEVRNFQVENQCDAFVRLLDARGTRSSSGAVGSTSGAGGRSSPGAVGSASDGADAFDVVGISYGGLVAFCLAHELPHRVRRLVMVSSPGPAYHRDDHDAALARFGVEDLASLILPDEPEGVRRVLELAWYRPPPTPRFVLEDVHRRLFTRQVEEKRQLLDAIQGQNESLARRGWVVDQPTLLVWGDHDPLFPLHVGLRLEDMLPSARLVVLPRTRHAPNTEQPRRFNRLVLEFLRTSGNPPAPPVPRPPEVPGPEGARAP